MAGPGIESVLSGISSHAFPITAPGCLPTQRTTVWEERGLKHPYTHTHTHTHTHTLTHICTHTHTHTHTHTLTHICTHTHIFKGWCSREGGWMEWEGCGGALGEGRNGVSVSPTLTHHLGHRVWMVGWNAPTVLLNAPLLPHMTIYWSCKSKRL